MTALIEITVAYFLLTGSVAALHSRTRAEIKVFAIDKAPSPPELIVPKTARSARHKRASSPANLRSSANEIVALPPPVALMVSTPVLAATRPGPGRDALAGASTVRGPGTGSGESGTGDGGGGIGDGDGGDETPPYWRKGRLSDSDYPRAAGDAEIGGTVSVRYLVGIDGRVSDCEVMRSSGNADLDSTTCRLIVERFRYDPSRDAGDRTVPSYVTESHNWAIRRDSPETR